MSIYGEKGQIIKYFDCERYFLGRNHTFKKFSIHLNSAIKLIKHRTAQKCMKSMISKLLEKYLSQAKCFIFWTPV